MGPAAPAPGRSPAHRFTGAAARVPPTRPLTASPAQRLGHARSPFTGAAARARPHAGSPIKRLHEDMQNAAAGETDCKRLVVGVAEGAHFGLTGLQNRQRLGHDGALDTPTRDGSGHLAVLAHSHGGARIPWPRALHADDAGDCDPPAVRHPLVYSLEHFSHLVTTTFGLVSHTASTAPPAGAVRTPDPASAGRQRVRLRLGRSRAPAARGQWRGAA